MNLGKQFSLGYEGSLLSTDLKSFLPNSDKPSEATGSTVNKTNPLMKNVLGSLGRLAETGGSLWIQNQLNKNQEQTQTQKENAQEADNFYGRFNGSGPIDRGLAAIASRGGQLGQFYQDPYTQAANPANGQIKAATVKGASMSAMVAGVALLGLIVVLFTRKG